MYLIPKIHWRLSNIPGRPIILNCGATTDKVSKFLDFQLKLVMQSSKSCIKDSRDLIRKIKDIQYIPSNTILVTAGVVGHSLQFPMILDLKSLRTY